MIEPPSQVPHEDFPSAVRDFYEAVNEHVDQDTEEANIRFFKRSIQQLTEGERDKTVRFSWMHPDDERGVTRREVEYEYRYDVWHRHDHTVM